VRPEGLRNESAPSEIEQQRQAGFAENLARGKPPELAADMVFEAIRGQRFWVTTDSDWDERFSSRFESILQRRNPESQMPVRPGAT
jgi:hypothetical protein